MAAITLTAAQISAVNENEYEGETYLKDAATTITVGQAVAIDGTTGKVVLADASTGSDNNVRGIVDLVAGNVVHTIKNGSMFGFDLTDLDYDAPVYVSNTAGGLDTAAGDVSLVVGRVKPMHDGTPPTKVLYVNIPAIM